MAEANFCKIRMATFFMLFHGIMLVAGGSSITWYEPPPSETVTDTTITSTTYKNLTKGFFNEELSCGFNLTADMSLVAVSFELGHVTVASYLPSHSLVNSYYSRFNATWVPTKLTLIVVNVTSDDKGEYRCRVQAFSGGLKMWLRKIEVDVLVQSQITYISGEVVAEGGNVTLKCLSEGNPPPIMTWTRLSDNSVVTMPLTNIRKQDAGEYRCTADNGVGTPATRNVFIDVQYSPEANGNGQNATVAEGVEHTFSCPVDGNPVPSFTWYSESIGKQFKTRQSGCYICVARNVHGISDNITQCLIIEPSLPTASSNTDPSNTLVSSITASQNPSETIISSITASHRQKIQATLTIIANYEQAFKDLNAASSKEFVAKFEQEMDQLYKTMSEYIRTEVTQLSPGSVIVYFILYFKTAVTAEKGIENLRVAVSSTGTFGDFQAKNLVLISDKSTKSTTTTGFKCTCSDNETTLLVIIAVLGAIIILLVAVIIWQQRKLRNIEKKRTHGVPKEGDAGFYDYETAMKDVNPSQLLPKNSTKQQISKEPEYMPLQGMSPIEEGCINPESRASDIEYAPLHMRTRSWEVATNDVQIKKIIGKGAFGQVAKGMAKNLPFRSEVTSVAIKMVKANAPESDKQDLKSELELLKTLKPHPHVIKLLGCVTESEPLLVLIEYVPYGDLLGYLRKSRGLNDTYFNDPDIKPKTSLTSQQLMKFAWQIADGMSYLSLRKVVHRDLAARNVLVGERQTCKITDFGMARDVQKENIYERKTKGRLPVKWTAYESLLYGQYTTKSDVWSYGIVLYEISTVGGSPYPRIEGRKIANLLQQGYRMPKPEHVENDLYQIMMNCWQSEPETRPSFCDLTQQLKGMENQRKSLINMHIYDNTLYANLEDLNA
ncbi:fibroblast growth factor receptor 2-like isoform X1 [Acropora millepora]|uniref:fibroblast growth factor receptor 2-like isoform X1 n=1 Tax=Acropora millepora TaxID=45264 RepID=UPI001CF34C8C|nr:fibroblast growth factor receptor 2-like isoform X1 [Acropora millepora]